MREVILQRMPRLPESFILVRFYKGFPITVRFPGHYFFLPRRKCMNFHSICKFPGEGRTRVWDACVCWPPNTKGDLRPPDMKVHADGTQSAASCVRESRTEGVGIYSFIHPCSNSFIQPSSNSVIQLYVSTFNRPAN